MHVGQISLVSEIMIYHQIIGTSIKKLWHLSSIQRSPSCQLIISRARLLSCMGKLAPATKSDTLPCLNSTCLKCLKIKNPETCLVIYQMKAREQYNIDLNVF